MNLRAVVEAGVVLWSRYFPIILFVLSGCSDTGDALDESPTPSSQIVLPSPTEAIPEVLLPDTDFRVHPSDSHVPLGSTQRFVAANFGVPLQGDVSWTLDPQDSEHGSFEEETGYYIAPENLAPENPRVSLTASWTDTYGRAQSFTASILISEWAWEDVAGPGPGCAECESQIVASADGQMLVYRHPYGLWKSEGEVLVIKPPDPGDSPDDNCATPSLDPQAETPPGLNPTEPQGETPTSTATPSAVPTDPQTPTPEDSSGTPAPPTPTRVQREFINASGKWQRTGEVLPGEGGNIQMYQVPDELGGLMAVTGGVLYRSPDSGQSWSAQPLSGSISALSFYPENSAQIVVASEIEGQQYLGKTEDGGQLWKEWSTGLEQPIRALSLVPKLTSRVLAATDDALYVSEDGGRSFESTLEGLDGVYGLWAQLLGRAWAIVQQSERRLLLFSDTAGEAWSPYSGISGCSPANLSVDPGNPYYIWISCVGGRLLYSVDAGNTFQPFSAQIGEELGEDVYPTVITSPNLMVHMTVDGVDQFYYYDQDLGIWWRFSGGPGPRISSIRSGNLLRPDATSGFLQSTSFPGILVGTQEGWVEGSISPSGAYWVSKGEAALPSKLPVKDMAFDGLGEYAVLTSEDGLVYGAEGGFEATFESHALPQDFVASSVDLDPVNAENWWVAGQGVSGSALLFKEGTGALEVVAHPDVHRVRISSEGSQAFFGLGQNQVYKSEDGIEPWTSVGPESREAHQLKTQGGEVLLGADFGLYTSKNEGQSFELLGWSESAVEAMCRLDPRTTMTESNSVPSGTAGYLAYSSTLELGVRHDNLGFFNQIPNPLNETEQTDKPRIIDLEPSGAYPGAAYAWVEGRGLYLVRPAPVQNLGEPGVSKGADSEPGSGCP